MRSQVLPNLPNPAQRTSLRSRQNGFIPLRKEILLMYADVSPPAAEPDAPPQNSLFDQLYPQKLRQTETEQIIERRKLNSSQSDAPRIGITLSNGGIRSATFC